MITSAKYWKNTTEENARTIKAVINGVTCLVPMDNENTDYQNILQWVADGNTIQEAD
jgi:hypothetical protein|tara:strand:+ start:463 stop:633 length:171 start_codon:yes stop_codon:yes gene_type:complete